MYDNAEPFMTSVPAPYPPVAVREKNPFYAALLAEDFAAATGELTAIHQYVYQSWIFAQRRYDIARILRNIARMEMLHLDILGQLITLLGCVPKYGAAENGRRVFWQGEMVSYERNFGGMLERDICLEKEAIRSYSEHAEQIQDARVQTMLQRLILDEQLHLDLFMRLRDSQF